MPTLKAIFTGSRVTHAAVRPLTAATTIAGQSPRTMSPASTGTKESVTSPTQGSLISRRSVSVAKMTKATMSTVKGAGSVTPAATDAAAAPAQTSAT
ncbi:MAG: hypothetical protein BWY94_01829 [Actinobacteria bacterium ADurb.BinA094]|nr:MAG: hypothetical protein BWY94_01829 [Actinobacteria bacterium ADurb.BinA094]